MKVREVLERPELKAVVEEYAPRLMDFPIKIFANKKCGDMMDIIIGKGLAPKSKVEEIEEKINKLL